MAAAFSKKRNAPAAGRWSVRKIGVRNSADLRAKEAAMILYADPAAAEQISHRRCRFTAAFGAGTNGEDEIAEGKLFGLAEDLRVLFHVYASL